MEEKDEKKEINPMNGAGEYLYFTTNSIVDPTTEGMPLTGGFDNGHNAKAGEQINLNKKYIPKLLISGYYYILSFMK